LIVGSKDGREHVEEEDEASDGGGEGVGGVISSQSELEGV
jgi:hypothetical protein